MVRHCAPKLGTGKFGGAEEDRTPDLRIANATLSQLSYGPDSNAQVLGMVAEAWRNVERLSGCGRRDRWQRVALDGGTSAG